MPCWPCTYSLHLPQHFVFDVDVLKHGLHDHVSLLKASVVQPAGQVTQSAVPLERRDVLLPGFVIESGDDIMGGQLLQLNW